MSYTLLQLVDQACGELGLAQPAPVIGSNVNLTAQLLALCQRLGKDLIREYEWQQLVKIYVFTTTASITNQNGTLTSGSKIITGVPSTASLAATQVIAGTGIPAYAEIASVDSATQITINMPATAGGFQTFTATKQDYALPSDFDRMVKDTHWDRTDHWRNIGTKSPQEWGWLQGGLISTGPRECYRLYNNVLRLFPAPTAALNLAFEYVSNFWVLATGGTAATKATFTVDTDTSIFPDDLMLAGLKYYFLKAKKFDFGIELAEFQSILSIRKAQDVPAQTLSLAPVQLPELVGPWSISDGTWPTTSS